MFPVKSSLNPSTVKNSLFPDEENLIEHFAIYLENLFDNFKDESPAIAKSIDEMCLSFIKSTHALLSKRTPDVVELPVESPVESPAKKRRKYEVVDSLTVENTEKMTGSFLDVFKLKNTDPQSSCIARAYIRFEEEQQNKSLREMEEQQQKVLREREEQQKKEKEIQFQALVMKVKELEELRDQEKIEPINKEIEMIKNDCVHFPIKYLNDINLTTKAKIFWVWLTLIF